MYFVNLVFQIFPSSYRYCLRVGYGAMWSGVHIAWHVQVILCCWCLHLVQMWLELPLNVSNLNQNDLDSACDIGEGDV